MKEIEQEVQFRKPVLDHEIPLDRRQFAFQIAKPIWPNSIDTSEKTYLPGNGCFIPNLSNIWDETEIRAKELLSNQSQDVNEDVEAMLWLFYCFLHNQAFDLNKVFPENIVFEDIDEIYRNGHPIRSI